MDNIERTNLAALEKRKKYYQDKAFRMVIEIAFIFGVPAFIAFRIGRYLDLSNDSGRTWTFLALLVSFFVSWTIMIMRYRKISTELKSVDAEIKRVKQEESNKLDNE